MDMNSVTLDRTFVQDLKKLAGGPDRPEYFDALAEIDAARRDLSTTDARSAFKNAVKKHGRAAVGVCVAATLHRKGVRIGFWGYVWAEKVFEVLPQRLQRAAYLRGVIDDGIHPTAICEYAAELVKMTTEH